ncbi:DNA-binding protein, partial [Bacillus pseudomycoides]
MQQKDWLSAEEVAKEIKVSAMTIKRNCQTYSSFLNFQQGEKNKYLIHQECIPVFQF